MARVKVYQLNNEGQWDDKGTGNVHHSVADDGNGEFVILTVMCEDTGEILLEHQIKDTIEYSRQGWYLPTCSMVTPTVLVFNTSEQELSSSLSHPISSYCQVLFSFISFIQIFTFFANYL